MTLSRRLPARTTAQPGTVSSGANGLIGSSRASCSVAWSTCVASSAKGGSQDGPRDRSICGGQGITGGSDEPVGHSLADLQATGRTEPDEPGAAQRSEPGRFRELGRDQPADLGGQYVGQGQGQTGEGPVQARSTPVSAFGGAGRGASSRAGFGALDR